MWLGVGCLMVSRTQQLLGNVASLERRGTRTKSLCHPCKSSEQHAAKKYNICVSNRSSFCHHFSAPKNHGCHFSQKVLLVLGCEWPAELKTCHFGSLSWRRTSAFRESTVSEDPGPGVRCPRPETGDSMKEKKEGNLLQLAVGFGDFEKLKKHPESNCC